MTFLAKDITFRGYRADNISGIEMQHCTQILHGTETLYWPNLIGIRPFAHIQPLVNTLRWNH